MGTMESHWDFNISKGGRHWCRVVWTWNNDKEVVIGKCRTIMVAMGLDYEYSLTLWEGRGKGVSLTEDWSLVKAVYAKGG